MIISSLGKGEVNQINPFTTYLDTLNLHLLSPLWLHPFKQGSKTEFYNMIEEYNLAESMVLE